MLGYFLPHANVVEPFLPEAVRDVCERTASALQSFSLLISYLLIYF